MIKGIEDYCNLTINKKSFNMAFFIRSSKILIKMIIKIEVIIKIEHILN